MVRATSQQQQLSEFLGELNGKPKLDSSSTEQEASVSEMKWVPGFIWVTRFALSGREVAEKWPHLLAVSAIESVSEFQDYQRTGLRCGCIALQTADDTAGVRTVLETPEEIAERIRLEWEGRVSLQAEIRRAVESGETE